MCLVFLRTNTLSLMVSTVRESIQRFTSTANNGHHLSLLLFLMVTRQGLEPLDRILPQDSACRCNAFVARFARGFKVDRNPGFTVQACFG